MNELKAKWFELTSRYTDNDQLIDKLWEEIEKSYSYKKRHYHNLTHLEHMLTMAVKYKIHLNDFDTVLFSIYYHDIVYNPKRQDNEQKSAEIAHNHLTRLSMPSEKTTNCINQIMATKYHEHSADNDTNYFVDLDLAILGESPKHYKDYAEKIRKEYAMYPTGLFNKARKNVLQHFLKRDKIYQTKLFQDLMEEQARANLNAELRGLKLVD